MARIRREEVEVERPDVEWGGEDAEEQEVQRGIFGSEEMRDEYVQYILEQVKLADSEIDHEMLEKYRKHRENVPIQASKNYPFPGASNASVPLTSIVTNTMFGKIYDTFSVLNPPWTMDALRDDPQDREVARTMTEYMTMLANSPSDLNLKDKQATVFYEAGSIGVCFVKTAWVRDEVNYKYEESPGVVGEDKVVRHDGPDIIPIPREDVLYRVGATDFARSPWVAHRVYLYWYDLVDRAQRNVYDPDVVEELKEWGENQMPKVARDASERHGDMPNQLGDYRSELWEILEVYAIYDVDGDGKFESVVTTIHKDTGKVLAERYNEVGMHPIVPLIYFKVPFRVEGRGTCQMTYHMQEIVNTLWNSRIDNIHINMVRMFAVKKHSGIGKGERIMPGKLWFVDNPREDIMPLQASEVYPSSGEAEAMAFQYGQKNSGMSDVMAGFADQTLKSRDNAAMMMTRLQQGQGIFGSIVESTKNAFSQIGQLVVYHLVRNKERVLANERKIGRLTEKQMRDLEEFLNIKMGELPYRFKFNVKTTDPEQTFEVKRQNYLTLTQLYTMYSEKLMQLRMTMENPQVPEGIRQFATEIYVGASKLMQKIFTFMGEEDTQEYIPEYRKQAMMLELQDILTGEMVKGLEKQIEGVRDGLGAGERGRGPVEGMGGLAGPDAGRGPQGNGNAGMGGDLEDPLGGGESGEFGPY